MIGVHQTSAPINLLMGGFKIPGANIPKPEGSSGGSGAIASPSGGLLGAFGAGFNLKKPPTSGSPSGLASMLHGLQNNIR